MDPIKHSLADIAAAQNESNVFAFDRGCIGRNLTRLQRIYAAKCAQLESFYYFFDAGQPDIVLRSGTGQELALRLPTRSGVGDIYAAVRDALDTELRELERLIVEAHLDVERDVRENEEWGHSRADKPDYVPAILELCSPLLTAEAKQFSLTTLPLVGEATDVARCG